MNSMDQVRKRFVLYAALAIFVLLTVLLGIINVVNFTMASEDADQITQTLASRQGTFDNRRDGAENAPSNVPENALSDTSGNAPPDARENTLSDTSGNAPPDAPENMPLTRRRGGERGPRVGPMGPDSPEMMFSTRYFTYAFDRDGTAHQIAFHISAVSEDEARAWADSLRSRTQIGWTRTTYRYRVYHDGGQDYVTVIDQGRELLPSFRILIISVSGEILGLLISCLSLLYVSKRLFKPLEEADRKQKRFIAEVEQEFKVPLTVIHAGTELIERERGESEQTQSIHRQVKRMEALVKDLSALSVFDAAELEEAELPLSEFANAAADDWREKLSAKGIDLRTDIADRVMLRGDAHAIAALLDELLENIWKFAKRRADFQVKTEGERVLIITQNGTDLPAGNVDQVFDRFTRLDNAKDAAGVGLGLFRVKEIVRAHNGRISAKVADGVFTVSVYL